MRTNPRTTSRRFGHHHGVAMLLVLISLMTATVLTAAYLASRDNSGAIGDNVANASAARWGAASGLNLAVAMLQTESGWRTNHTDGIAVPNFEFAQTTLELSLKDLETNGPPNATTTYVQALMSATAGDIEHEASAVLMVPVPKVASVDLSEFAMFTSGTIALRDTARLMRWSESPLSRLGLPLSVGTRSSALGAVSLTNSSLAVDTTAWLPPGSNFNGVSNASMLQVNALLLQDSIPLPAAPQPVLSGISTTRDELLPGDNLMLDTYNIELNSGAVVGSVSLAFQGRTLVINDSLNIAANAQLRLSGDAVIIVHGDLTLDASASIELDANSRLRIFVEGDVDIRGFVGEQDGMTSGANSDGLGHADVSRIHFLTRGTGQYEWQLRETALFKGVIYAPAARVVLSGSSRLCGRIAAREIELTNQATLYYDHSLDRRTGYTNPTSFIYDEDGRAKASFVALQSLDQADLETLAAVESIRIRAVNIQYGAASVLEPTVADGESTPRPIPITYSDVSYDTNVASWERR